MHASSVSGESGVSGHGNRDDVGGGIDGGGIEGEVGGVDESRQLDQVRDRLKQVLQEEMHVRGLQGVSVVCGCGVAVCVAVCVALCVAVLQVSVCWGRNARSWVARCICGVWVWRCIVCCGVCCSVCCSVAVQCVSGDE